jgi:hypothetical protein
MFEQSSLASLTTAPPFQSLQQSITLLSGICGSFNPFRQMLGQHLKTGHYHITSHPFQFIIHTIILSLDATLASVK